MESKPIRVVFMGSPDFAVPSLDALHASGRYSPMLVVSQPDRPRGRGRQTTPTAVRARALELGLKTDVMTKETYTDVVSRIGTLEPEVVIVVAFGVILRADLLEMPRLGCVNVHASLLPDHRGVSPIQAAILAGDNVTGCTTMHIDAGIDTGDVYLIEESELLPTDTAGSLSDRLARLGAHLLIRTIDGLVDGTLSGAPQGETTTPYTKKVRKKHGLIGWSGDAATVERCIRAMTPWPSAFTFVGSRRLIITEAAVANNPAAAETVVAKVPDGVQPGEVVSLDPLTIACGTGAIEIRRLKPEGGKSMSPAAFLAGNPLEIGVRLGVGD